MPLLPNTFIESEFNNLNGVIYTRASTTQQTTSIPRQLNCCREFARKHRVNVLCEYQDFGVGGEKPDLSSSLYSDRRLGFEAMILRGLIYADYDLIIVEDYDRFSRFPDYILDKYIDAISWRNIQLVSVFRIKLRYEYDPPTYLEKIQSTKKVKFRHKTNPISESIIDV